MKLTEEELKKWELKPSMHVPVHVTMKNKKQLGFKRSLFVFKKSEIIGLEANMEDVEDIFEVMGYGKGTITVEGYVEAANELIRK